MLQFILIITLSLILCPLAHSHLVQQIAGDLTIDQDQWTLDLTFDIGFAEGNWKDIDEPQKERDYLTRLSADESETLRKNSTEFVRKFITTTTGPAQISFPDFDTSPPSFPHILTGGAYLTVRLSGNLPAQDLLAILVAEGDFPNLIIIDQRQSPADFHTIFPGDRFILQSSSPSEVINQPSLTGWIKLGFLHVIPDHFGALDHVLFIIALCLFSQHWRPILSQSLIFTVAHMATLSMVAAGFIPQLGPWVEIVIAASIIVLALDSLRPRKKSGWPRHLLIFIFGLIHGLGFGASLGAYLQNSPNFITTLALMNLGVELGQIFTIALTLLILALFQKLAWTRGRQVLCLLVITGGLSMVIERI